MGFENREGAKEKKDEKEVKMKILEKKSYLGPLGKEKKDEKEEVKTKIFEKKLYLGPLG